MFYRNDDLKKIGFKSFGKNVLISNKCSIYGANKITIGNNVRIDDFCILSAGKEIVIGNNIHIGCYTCLIGSETIIMEDFSGLSMKCVVLSSSDDFSGDFLTNPMIDKKFLNVTSKSVHIGKHVIVGSGSIILPGVKLGDGVSIGAMSLVKKSINSFEIWAGNPITFIKMRNNKLLELEKEYLKTKK